MSGASEAAATKRITLSFDDAPRGAGPMFSGDERAARLIRTLASATKVPVVFFVTPRGFERAGGRERIERYAAAGHLIANHTDRHPWLSRTETEEYLAGVDTAERLLAGIENRRPWFRFPYLDEGTPREKRDRVRAGLAKRGLRNGYVTVDNYDWYIESKWQAAVKQGRSVNMEALRDVYVEMLTGAVEFYDQAAVEALGRSPAHVLLLHENDLAAMFVGDLVAALREAGWSVISPDEAYADPVAERVPHTLATRQGHIGALAIESGRTPNTMTHLAIEETQIDALLEERAVFGRAPKPGR